MELQSAAAFKTGLIIDSGKSSEKEENSLCLQTVENHRRNCTSAKASTILNWYLFNSAVDSILQGYQKPLCGLVALGMAGKMLQKLKPTITVIPPEKMLNAAIKLGVSKMGEIFSVFEMQTFATQLYQCKAVVVEKSLSESSSFILKELLLGHPVLVPYDNDKNFEPCLRKGHRAHWAVLTGAVLGCPSECMVEDDDVESVNNTSIWRLRKSRYVLEKLGGIDVLFATIRPSEIYVFAKQGKSAKNRLWSIESLSRSNANLVERDPSKDWTTLHCPYDIKDTLKSRYLVLRV